MAEQRPTRLVRPTHLRHRRYREQGESCSQTAVEGGIFQRPGKEYINYFAEFQDADDFKFGGMHPDDNSNDSVGKRRDIRGGMHTTTFANHWDRSNWWHSIAWSMR